jgi:hypothetical protein
MTQDEIIEMAKQAQMPFYWRTGEITYLDKLEAFAKLVAEHEREARAKDLDEASEAAKDVDPQGFVWRAVKECADAIRARGQA